MNGEYDSYVVQRSLKSENRRKLLRIGRDLLDLILASATGTRSTHRDFGTRMFSR